jgi:hypothetical protein
MAARSRAPPRPSWRIFEKNKQVAAAVTANAVNSSSSRGAGAAIDAASTLNATISCAVRFVVALTGSSMLHATTMDLVQYDHYL